MLTPSFLRWIFESHCDSDQGNYGNLNRNSEYGISQADAWLSYTTECMADAQAYWDKADNEFKSKLVGSYRDYAIQQCDHWEQEAGAQQV